jgi:hypothetical protein
MTVDGKPLLVSYADYGDRLNWESAAIDKTNSGHFTIRWAQGQVPAENPTPPILPPGDYGLYYGWAFIEGSQPNSEAMVVMPGWNNHRLGYTPVPRAGGTFYSGSNWDRVIDRVDTNPLDFVIINSFNEYAEETAIAPADTSQVLPPTEPWPSPTFYWDMTLDYLALLKGDADADRVMDPVDNCPDDANAGQENADGDVPGDACDNCPATATPWTVPPGDGDCDYWTDAAEAMIGTDAAKDCDDGAGLPDWPPDFNDDTTINILDVLQIKPVFGLPSSRHDLNMSGGNVDILDVLALKPVFNQNCGP